MPETKPAYSASVDSEDAGGQRQWTAVGDEVCKEVLEVDGCAVALPALEAEGSQLDNAFQAPSLAKN